MKNTKLKFFTNSIFEKYKMPIITIYFNPGDFKAKYVARIFDFDKPTPYIIVKDSLNEIREEIPSRFVNMGRNKKDDKCIVEVWI